jgi:polysaccharide export outer membrane protein
LVLVALLLGACSQLPTTGPTRQEVEDAVALPGQSIVQIVDVDDGIARRLLAQRRVGLFSDALGNDKPAEAGIGAGDSLEISVWEAPPATLFGGGSVDPRTPNSVRSTTFPEQVVDAQGFVSVPFAGRIRVTGLSPQQVEAEVVRRLTGKANQPEVIVRRLRNASSTVTIVGEVTNSVRMPLTPGGERLLDALAAAGGVRQPVSKTTLQVTRGGKFHSLPLDVVIRDPRQNVPLQPGDVLTAMFQPLSFTALGATGKNEEISFEAQGISLAQALARAGGLVDSRSNPQGVFIFRLEQASALDWPRRPATTTPDGLVPVIYRLDLRNPATFFVMQSFPVQHKDILYVSNAPAAEIQKFLNLVFSIAYPVINTISLTR